jgi:hypothetical protein
VDQPEVGAREGAITPEVLRDEHGALDPVDDDERRPGLAAAGLDVRCLFELVAHNFHLKGVDTVLDARPSVSER